jgi:hypothetical protein
MKDFSQIFVILITFFVDVLHIFWDFGLQSFIKMNFKVVFYKKNIALTLKKKYDF